ncbi:MAG: carbon starvation protein A [Bacteroidetes bacterium]|jgi:carbon starvation protein|nr:carbon starvation protein A [Bacteroidota bacterium]MBT3749103.1 carbon starvation protein A [Bacteroidota bacterium]MBT4399690.1 carbon starvation protein A [Bacteroidota bacterium]MBT4409905.1 carbon starvation protein A [Bacteroidota bacterium]MBT5425352.1 carbon starvation protein A [Bacteroidota bacterium]
MLAIGLLSLLFLGYLGMYHLYGKFLARRIFKISSERITPAVEMEDGRDYVPTKKQVIFGHHFTSIAGTGPIVGPAIAIIWGWVPAILWVFLGSLVMGAVHDFGSLVISLRNKGKSISDYTAKYINNRTRFLFFLIVFLELWIVISVFGLVIASIFKIFPSSVIPVWFQIPIAIALGFALKKKKVNLTVSTIIAVAVMYLTVVVGRFLPLEMPDLWGIPSTGLWTILLLIYAFIASVLPVTTLLQPRDFINAYQLVVAMGIIVLGVLISGIMGDLEMVAPAIQVHPSGAPPVIPFLFITIACGAISGFHSLVSSGTTAKQIRSEKDSLFVGYGSMLTEGALAILVIIAVGAGIGLGHKSGDGSMLFGIEAWSEHYSSWAEAGGLGKKIGAFVEGSANMIGTIGIPVEIAVVIMGVFVASFAGTTLDTATRIQRYVIGEIFAGIRKPILHNIYFTTFIAVASAAILAFATGADGKGALKLWPLFGAVNQTLAALALIIITIYLKPKGKLKWLVSGIPAIFMIVVTLWATTINQINFMQEGNILLATVNLIVLIIVVWITAEGLIRFVKVNNL